jgi:hypothetical protein
MARARGDAPERQPRAAGHHGRPRRRRRQRLIASTCYALNLALIFAAAIVLSWKLALGAWRPARWSCCSTPESAAARRLGEALSDAYRQIHARLEETLDGSGCTRASAASRKRSSGAADLRLAARRGTGRSCASRSRRAGSCRSAGRSRCGDDLARGRALGTPPLVLLPLVAVCARALPQLQGLQEAAQQFAMRGPRSTTSSR